MEERLGKSDECANHNMFCRSWFALDGTTELQYDLTTKGVAVLRTSHAQLVSRVEKLTERRKVIEEEVDRLEKTNKSKNKKKK